MADELDVDALLEEPLNKTSKSKKRDKERSRTSEQKSREKSRRSRSRDRKDRPPSKDRHRRRSKSRERKRDKSQERRRRRSRSQETRRKSRSPKKEKSRSPRRQKSAEKSPRRQKSQGKSREKSRSPRRQRSPEKAKSPRKPQSPDKGWSPGRQKSPGKEWSPKKPRSLSPAVMMTPEERDARTVFVMQLSHRCRARDIQEFFSAVGKVQDIRLIMCNKTRRFKGIAYVEFKDIESVALAHGLNGQKLLGVPVIVQPSQAEKNRVGMSTERLINRGDVGPMRLYVGSLHFNITEEMLRGIFEPFGPIISVQILYDQETGRSRGYGFVTYHEAKDAKKALDQMNGFELAGRPIKVGHITEKTPDMINQTNPNFSDYDELGRNGYDLGATGRLALMAKLAEGTGMKLPDLAAQALANNAKLSGAGSAQSVAAMAAAAAAVVNQHHKQQAAAYPPIATQCFMLSNMFDPATETLPNWEDEIRDDVIDECNKQGGVLHIFVDRTSQGNVYVKCTSVESATQAVNTLHGRWFAGKVITAAYVPLINYHSLFPDSIVAQFPLTTIR